MCGTYFSLCIGVTVRTTDRIMCVFTIFNRLHFCEINSYIAVHSDIPYLIYTNFHHRPPRISQFGTFVVTQMFAVRKMLVVLQFMVLYLHMVSTCRVDRVTFDVMAT